MQVMRCHRFNYQVQMYEISVAPNSGLLGMSSVNVIGMAASHKRFGCVERVELAYIEQTEPGLGGASNGGICHYLTSSSSSLQGIAKASFVSALASFVVPFSHDARIDPSFIRDFCCMIASKSPQANLQNTP